MKNDINKCELELSRAQERAAEATAKVVDAERAYGDDPSPLKELPLRTAEAENNRARLVRAAAERRLAAARQAAEEESQAMHRRTIAEAAPFVGRRDFFDHCQQAVEALAKLRAIPRVDVLDGSEAQLLDRLRDQAATDVQIALCVRAIEADRRKQNEACDATEAACAALGETPPKLVRIVQKDIAAAVECERLALAVTLDVNAWTIFIAEREGLPPGALGVMGINACGTIGYKLGRTIDAFASVGREMLRTGSRWDATLENIRLARRTPEQITEDKKRRTAQIAESRRMAEMQHYNAEGPRAPTPLPSPPTRYDHSSEWEFVGPTPPGYVRPGVDLRAIQARLEADAQRAGAGGGR